MATWSTAASPTSSTSPPAWTRTGRCAAWRTSSRREARARDIPFFEGNLPPGTAYQAINALPPASFRILNQGIAGSRRDQQYDEACGILEDKNVIDVASPS